jgi:hypothetical protein
LSYFAKPNFIIYDEWFDEDLKKNKFDIKNKKIKTISNIHEYFYDQSNYKVGASENNLKLDLEVYEKEQLTNNYLENTSEIFIPEANKKFRFLKKITQSKLKFNFKKILIYSLLIFGLLLLLIILKN